MFIQFVYVLFVSNYVLSNWGNFTIKLLCHFKDIALFVLASFLLPHPVDNGYNVIIDAYRI